MNPKHPVLAIALLAAALGANAEVFNVAPAAGDMTRQLQSLIDKAIAAGPGSKIVLAPGDYNISRKEATPVLIHVSNTTSEKENPDPTKHIGMLLKNASGLTVEGFGARIVTHGEMTWLAAEDCSGLTLTGLTVASADPSVPEMTVTSLTDSTLTVRPHALSQYEIRNGKFFWKGEAWEFTDGYSQIYHPSTRVTHYTKSPLAAASKAETSPSGDVVFHVKPESHVGVGDVFQMRHTFRTEVCALLYHCRDVKMNGINFNFMGNFGIVAQYSSDLSFSDIVCAPDPDSGRTNAGFADFFQISGCRGKVSFDNCTFSGSHDDPINVHGTQLRIVGREGKKKLKVRFMHHQTFGFPAFNAGDSVAVNDCNSLLHLQTGVLERAQMLNDREMLLTFRDPVADFPENAVVENLTWNPEVEITRCFFERTPTRGILVTTPRKVVISDNTFFRCRMAAILIADDARSWYESGAVTDVTIKKNRFIECSSPVISIAPECSRIDGPVHTGIVIEDNAFIDCKRPYVRSRAAEVTCPPSLMSE